MSQADSFNPHLIHDAAAHLFWTLAAGVGVAAASDEVIETDGTCLLAKPFSAAVLAPYGVAELSRDQLMSLFGSIAGEAQGFASRGENMQGIVYADDAENGRSPSAAALDTSILKVIPRDLGCTGAALEKIGKLCLRHPLPAVVFSERRPSASLIEVADTTTALGFHLPIFLSNISTQQLSGNVFASSGVFHIPVPHPEAGERWSGAIQNSSRFIDCVVFTSKAGETRIQVSW